MGVLLLVRHGQASFGADDYDVLSELGVLQSGRLGRELAGQDVRPDVVVHGGMRRQQHTAEAMTRAAAWPVALERDDRWDEFDHLAIMAAHRDKAPDVERLDRRAFQEAFEEATARWTFGAHDEEYAETFAGFVVRVRDALRDAARAAGPGRTAVVVTSGGCIAVAAAVLAGAGGTADDPRRLSGPWHRLNAVTVNASVTRIVVGSTGARLLTFNEHNHLDRDLVTYR